MLTGKNIPLFLLFLFVLLSVQVFGQNPVKITDSIRHHIFTAQELYYFEDTSGKLDFKTISTPGFDAKFQHIGPYKQDNTTSVYWYRFKLKHNTASVKRWILEFFDQTIQNISVYRPDANGVYTPHHSGTSHEFSNRMYNHKNLVFDLDNSANKELVYYVRVRSARPFTTLFVLRDMNWFVGYALNEYLAFGLFYGMIVVFTLYNLLMYMAIGQRKHLYYILYNISIGLYEMSSDGLAFQYLWRNHPWINLYAEGFFLLCSVLSGILFTIEFLRLKVRAPKFAKLLMALIVLRIVYFGIAIFNHQLFDYKAIELIPLALACTAGVYVYSKGYRPARFLIIGYGILILGLCIKLIQYFDLPWLPAGPFTHYSLSIGIILEMMLVSFAIAESIRALKHKKELAQKRTIDQLKINEKLQHTLNEELSELVDVRTSELREKTALVEKQHLEILAMNKLLEKDNQELNTNIQTIRKARVMSEEVDFNEFSRIYPDRETCFKFLSELKWSVAYQCRKCENQQFLAGLLPHSRRCTKCGYDESVLAHTIFQNSKIPINKAFYMLFLVYASKGKISSYKLSKLLEMRQSTCWTYNSKMQKVLEERGDLIKKAGKGGWSRLILDDTNQNVAKVVVEELVD